MLSPKAHLEKKREVIPQDHFLKAGKNLSQDSFS